MMKKYVPPFTITNRMLFLVSQISEKLGQISNYREFGSRPHLRRNNRIRSIHSSLAIEANSLTLDAVRGVIDGKTVLGPQREIQEVKNAFLAYEQIGEADPFSLGDLKRVHGIMTHLPVEESGVFRCGEEGVFDGDRCIFMAPPAINVPNLMDNLFDWMRSASQEVHFLILSSVFHYEFVFIHPFADGNGRMARLWQTILLAQWNPVFRYLPIESSIHAYQSDYYAAIAQCHSMGHSNIFIEFMLEKISDSLDLVLKQASNANDFTSSYVLRLLSVMESGIPYTAAQMLSMLELKSKETLRKHYINPALDSGLIIMGLPDKPTSRNQTYIRK